MVVLTAYGPRIIPLDKSVCICTIGAFRKPSHLNLLESDLLMEQHVYTMDLCLLCICFGRCEIRMILCRPYVTDKHQCYNTCYLNLISFATTWASTGEAAAALGIVAAHSPCYIYFYLGPFSKHSVPFACLAHPLHPASSFPNKEHALQYCSGFFYLHLAKVIYLNFDLIAPASWAYPNACRAFLQAGVMIR